MRSSRVSTVLLLYAMVYVYVLFVVGRDERGTDVLGMYRVERRVHW